MIQLDETLAELVRAWRRVAPYSKDNSTGRRPRLAVYCSDKEAHCAAITAFFHCSRRDDRLSVVRLGEVLRLMALASAPHVDPQVWSALWFSGDGLCPKGVSFCARCDAVERDHRPVIDLHIHADRDRETEVSIPYLALHEWDEAAASDAFRNLWNALHRPEAPPVCTPVSLVLHMIELNYGEPNTKMWRYAHMLIHKTTHRSTASAWFQITSINLQIWMHHVINPVCKSVLTAAFKAGLPITLTA